MLRRLFGVFGFGMPTPSVAVAIPPYSPYQSGVAANDIYNLVFCDLPDQFKPAAGQKPTAWQHILFDGPVDETRVASLANDLAQEGRIRYLMAFLEDNPQTRALVDKLLTASTPVVSRIGPWEQPRRPPPKSGSTRLTFLVSDGLYFGEGPVTVMTRDPMAGPIIEAAGQLLQVVARSSAK